MNIELIIFISAISIIVIFAVGLLFLDSRAKKVDRKFSKERYNMDGIEEITLGCSKAVYEYRQMLGWINELTRPAKISKQLPRNKRWHNIKSLTNKGKLK